MNCLKYTIFFALFYQATFAENLTKSSEILNQNIASKEALSLAKMNGEKYDTRNWLNPVLHNIYMANNRAETAQYRINLKNQKASLRYIDLLKDKPLDWKKIDISTSSGQKIFSEAIQQYHSIAAIDTTNLDKPESDVVILFSSASHNLTSASSLDIVTDLTRAGLIVVMMEYPGYGASLGYPSRENWKIASEGLIKFVSQNLIGHKIYVVGHSIGAVVALEAAAALPNLVSGVVSHGGFYNMYQAAKDSQSSKFLKFIAPGTIAVNKLFGLKEMWSAEDALKSLSDNKTPTLIIHGSKDSSVSPNHFKLMQNEVAVLAKKNSDQHIQFQMFDSTHEDIFTNNDYGPYSQIWSSIIGFIKGQNMSLNK